MTQQEDFIEAYSKELTAKIRVSLIASGAEWGGVGILDRLMEEIPSIVEEKIKKMFDEAGRYPVVCGGSPVSY